MSFRLRILAAAAKDIEAARDWYEGQQDGLGGVFLDAIDAALARITAKPLTYRLVRRDARRALVRRFPYVVIFRVKPDQIRILAVLHQHRDPEVAKRRIER